MHIRGWIILGISIVSLFALGYLALMVRKIYRRVHQLDISTDKAAHAEALSAHSRIDRIDQDQLADWNEMSMLRVMINSIKGQVKFLMHKDISDELSRQADAEKKKNKEAK